jgi:hypothetical protein
MRRTLNVATTPYRQVLDDLAHSRGFSGAEELAERAAEEMQGTTPRDVLENPPAYLGVALDTVLRLTEEEKVRLTDAFMSTFWGW